jgi:hypothetical protein
LLIPGTSKDVSLVRQPSAVAGRRDDVAWETRAQRVACYRRALRRRGRRVWLQAGLASPMTSNAKRPTERAGSADWSSVASLVAEVAHGQ